VTAGTAIAVDPATGAVSWTVPASAAGTTADVTLRVTDDGGLKATQAYRIAVGVPNQAPVITSSALTTAVANVAYRYAVTATDPNLPEDVLTYSIVIAPAGMTIAPLTGVVDWVPGAAVGGTSVTVALRVTDQLGLSATHCCPVRSPIDSVVWRGRVNRFGSSLLEVPVKWAFSRTE